MLLLLLLYTYLFFILYFTGKWFFNKVLKCAFTNEFYYIGGGIITITAAARIWSLFAPVNGVFQALCLTAAILSAINYRFKMPEFNVKKNFYFLLLVPVLIFVCSQQSISWDDGSYHASFIAWLNKYGSITGLANLHGRLGFNSNWHLFASVFNFDFLFKNPLNQVNGFFITWLLLLFLNEIEIHKDKKGIQVFSYSFIILLFFPVLLTYYAIDPSADYIVIFWSLLIFYELYFFKAKSEILEHIGFVVASVFFLLTIKLTSFYLFAFLFIFRKTIFQNFRQIRKLVLYASLIVIPWIISNYKISGYIVYPFLQTEILNPKWKVPAYIAATDIEAIKATPFIRWGKMDITSLKALSWSAKYIAWLKGIRLYEKFIFILSTLGFTCFFIYMFKRRSKFSREQVLVMLCVFGGYLFIFLTAPDFRFLASSIYFLIAVSMAELVKSLRSTSSYWKIAIICCMFQLVGTFKLYSSIKGKLIFIDQQKQTALNIISPAGYPVNRGEQIKIGEHSFYVCDHDKAIFCWNVIPNVITYQRDVNYLTSDFSGGFYQKYNEFASLK